MKKINDLGVFGVTSAFSMLAYVWMYVVLKVWSEGEVTLPEAVITFIFFFLLLGMAFLADKLNERRRRKHSSSSSEKPLDQSKASVAFESPRQFDSSRQELQPLSVARLSRLLERERTGRLTETH